MAEEKKKVGIITYSDSINWGAQLQAYALKTAIELKGYNAQQIDHREMAVGIYKKTKNIKSIVSNAISFLERKALQTRIERTKEFRQKYLNLTKKCHSRDAMVALNDIFDCFITGSDQVWNCSRGINSNFYLDFVIDNAKKCAYAASFGISKIPEHYALGVADKLSTYRYITVRESVGQEIISNLCNRSVPSVCDPVFLLTANQWDALIDESSQLELPKDKKYIFVYSTDLSKEFCTLVKAVRNHYKLPVISTTWIPGCTVVKDIGPSEFVDYIRNSAYVVTTSFHATAFSIIYGKKFCVLPHKTTGNRVTDILKKLNLSTQIATSDRTGIINEISYADVQKNLDSYRTFSLQELDCILNSTVVQKKPSPTNITVEELRDVCTGCRVCESVCPKKCIVFNKDTDGFIHPVIDREKCISCGLCANKCHVNGKLTQLNADSVAFYGYALDEDIHRKGSSGGAFGAIVSLEQSKENTWVYGSVYDSSDCSVHQQGFLANNIDRLYQSKYCFSDPRHTFAEVKTKLLNGERVIYCGTPCQIGALKSYLGDTYDNLLTIDFICHGVPSEDFLKKHIDFITNKAEGAQVEFRSKAHGWGLKKHCLKVTSKEQELLYLNKAGKDFYFTHFLNNDCLRLSCYHCRYSYRHASDLTFGDFWEVYRIDPTFDDKKGLSVIFANNKRGEALLQELVAVMELKKCPDGYTRGHCGCSANMIPQRNITLAHMRKVDFVTQERKFIYSRPFRLVLKMMKKIMR